MSHSCNDAPTVLQKTKQMKISVADVASPQISCTTMKQGEACIKLPWGVTWVHSLEIFQEVVSGMTAPTFFKAQ